MDEKERAVESLQMAIQSLNKAWDILGAQGLAGLVESGALVRAGCTEYCGSYDGCTGYCKPMGARLFGQEQITPAEPGLKAQRLPFSG